MPSTLNGNADWGVEPLKAEDLTTMAQHVPAVSTLETAGIAYAWSGRYRGELIGIGGFSPHWPGVESVWFFAVPGALHGRVIGLVARSIRAMLREAVTQRGVWRLQAGVHTHDRQAVTFVEHFAFQREGLMRRFGPDGADWWMYAWVK
jgi:L-amino acid N-acyltransferase YncA